MKKFIFTLLAAALTLPSIAQTTDYTSAAVIDADTALYSRLIINSCLYHFQANTRASGFAEYDVNGNRISSSNNGESIRGFDYVPGLVAKAVIECVDFYANDADLSFLPEAERNFFYPWFYSIKTYGNLYYSGIETGGGSLDNLNAAKLYFTLGKLASSSKAPFADAQTASHCSEALDNATKGLNAHNKTYKISAATSQAYCGSNAFEGGWWHKSSYKHEMWCDGQYMGPALLAELIHNGKTLSGKTADQCWDIVAAQMEMSWAKLWDPQKQLLYHAFTAAPAMTDGVDHTWADQNPGDHYGVSKEYWGRACGWYFLALVDILEVMPTNNPHYATLHGYLNSLATGLAARQDATTGCWYQLLQYGVNVPGVAAKNYLESSATAIFVATYLKAMRLNLLDKSTYEPIAKKGYHGFLKQFLATNVGDDNAYALIHNCASAGLGGVGTGSSKNRPGDAAYYLNVGNKWDTKQTNSYTEGKVLGAFILAATEYERAYTLPNLLKPTTDEGDSTTPPTTDEGGSTTPSNPTPEPNPNPTPEPNPNPTPEPAPDAPSETCHCLTVTLK